MTTLNPTVSPTASSNNKVVLILLALFGGAGAFILLCVVGLALLLAGGGSATYGYDSYGGNNWSSMTGTGNWDNSGGYVQTSDGTFVTHGW